MLSHYIGTRRGEREFRAEAVSRWWHPERHTASARESSSLKYSGYMIWLENEYRERLAKHVEPGRKMARNDRNLLQHIRTGNEVPIFVGEDPVILGAFTTPQRRELERRHARHQGLSNRDLLAAWDTQSVHIPNFQERWNVRKLLL